MPVALRLGMARFAIVLLAVCLAACSIVPSAARVASAAQVVAGPSEPVTLWQDAGIFRLVARLIGFSRTRVMVEMYELGRRDIVSALGSARVRGVAVRVITDPTVRASRRSSAALDSLGVAERVYPVDDVRHQIDHVKLLIADDTAVVAGMNWGNHSDRNHDFALETGVKAEVERLVGIFEQD